MISGGLWRCGLAVLLALAMTAPAGAQYDRLGLGQFKHSRWTPDDGAPPGATAIVQTPDGWIWMAAGDGLVRFDGVSFEAIPAPAGSPMEGAPVMSLMVSRAGELWVGYGAHGGVATYRDGRLQDKAMPRPGYVISRLVETADGAVWAVEAGQPPALRRLSGGRWEKMEGRLGVPGAIGAMRETPDGSLWIVVSDAGPTGRLAVLPPGAGRFQLDPQPVDALGRLSSDPSGGLWVSAADGVRLLRGADGRPPERPLVFQAPPGFSRGILAFDPAGGLWGTTGSAGIFYLGAAANRPMGDVPLRFLAADGLTANTAVGLLADREGAVWISTGGGLDQFRPAAALHEAAITGDPSRGQDIARGADGTIFASTSAGVFHIAAGRPPTRILDHPLHGMCGARDEGVWGFFPPHLMRYRGGRWERYSLPPEGQALGACAEDRLGRLWVMLTDGRLIWRTVDGGWRYPDPVIRSFRSDLVVTPSGGVAFREPGKLVQIDGERRIVSDLASPEALGIWAVAAGSRDLFVSGSQALFRVRDGRVARIDRTRAPWVVNLRGIVQTQRGETWLIREGQISRVSTADLDRAFADPRAPLARTVFNRLDGVASATQHIRFQGPQAFGDQAGRLWYLNQMGVAFIDPARLRSNPLPPPVVVRSLTAGKAFHRDPRHLTLPPGTNAVEIGYTALSLTAPRRVQFRYRLEGVDKDWVDPGARRLASYSNLGPGTYRFQVIAANNDGVWNRDGASLTFDIRPTFLQSWLFKVLLALALLGLLWLAYRLRMRIVTDRLRQRMAERMEERERIARELHDTLLQAAQALTLRFQLALDDLPKRARARPALETAIDQADQVIAEGRDRVRDLRSADEHGDIEQAVREILRRQGFAPAIDTKVTTTGAIRPLDPLVAEEIERIAGEAVFNVWRHARASQVAVRIGYHADFTLAVADDGVGIAPEVAQAGGREGHFGLSGMTERARKLRGRLAVRTRPEGGAEVVLTVPGRVAYRAMRRGFPWGWMR